VVFFLVAHVVHSELVVAFGILIRLMTLEVMIDSLWMLK
jgi:hypothetical protein